MSPREDPTSADSPRASAREGRVRREGNHFHHASRREGIRTSLSGRRGPHEIGDFVGITPREDTTTAPKTLDARARALGFAHLGHYLGERYCDDRRRREDIAEELGIGRELLALLLTVNGRPLVLCG